MMRENPEPVGFLWRPLYVDLKLASAALTLLLAFLRWYAQAPVHVHNHEANHRSFQADLHHANVGGLKSGWMGKVGD